MLSVVGSKGADDNVRRDQDRMGVTSSPNTTMVTKAKDPPFSPAPEIVEACFII
jgi:hypothetical protein